MHECLIQPGLQHRYLFNAGEGFQRYCVQHKLKVSRMMNILATRAAVDAVGGIPGERALTHVVEPNQSFSMCVCARSCFLLQEWC